ncbi:MAG: hypothetical protein JW741_16445 [Sedimentisphaerales bacterium]|nr:hypothetical protein [Sedimentisphaerales bacterium]
MARQVDNDGPTDLPECAAEFLRQVTRKMRYRRKAREEVQAELTAHFTDELKDCADAVEKEQKAQKMVQGFGDARLIAILCRRAKKRCRPRWKTAFLRTAQVAGALVACFIVYVIWFLSGKPVVTTDYIAQFNRLVRPPADEALNAAPFYIRAAETIEEPPTDIAELLKSKHRDLTAEQKQRLAAWFAERQEMFDLVAEGAQRPYYWRAYEGEDGILSVLLPYVSRYRHLMRALGHRAAFLADEGRHDEALAMVQTCYRYGRHLRAGNKSLIEQLGGIAAQNVATDALLDILSRHRLKPPELADLQQRLEGLFEDEDFRLNLEGEKLMIYDEIQRCFTTGGPAGEHLYPRRLASLSSSGERAEDLVFDFVTTPRYWGRVAKILFAHPDKEETRATLDRAYESWDDWLRMTPAQLRAEGIDVSDEMEKAVKGNFLLEVMVPSLGRVHELSYLTKVRFDAALAIVALLRFQAERGSYPENLAELVAAGYLQRVPADSWRGGPLTYRRTGADFLLYGWGENFTDDGGQPGKDEDDYWASDGDWVFWPVARAQS